MRHYLIQHMVIGTVVGFLAFGCAQEGVEWPDLAGADCGGYYPGNTTDTDAAADTDADTEIESTVYTFRQTGATAPCFAWESVRKGPQGADPTTYINLGELYLQVERAPTDTDIAALLDKQWGLSEPSHMVVVASADNCGACETLIGGGTKPGLADLKSEFEAANTVMLAALSYHFNTVTPAYTLEEADSVLLNHDGWPEDWHRTNDIESVLDLKPGAGENKQSYPQAFVVRLSDMKVIAYHPSGTDADLLLQIVQADQAN